jgi:release factor glutamine methyltransferase
MPSTVVHAWRSARARLEEAGCSSAALDASLLLAHVLRADRSVVHAQPDRTLSAAETSRLEALVAQRARRRPVSHLLGRTEFRSLEFEVTDAVLAPRPETEALVEAACAAAARAVEAGRTPLLADVGTGSGCIAVAVAAEAASARLLATDASGAALDVARRNAERHGVAERVTFLRGDLLTPVRAAVADGALDAVVSNPPYVRRSEAGEVDPEVLWEPASAVFCDGEPADLYARIAREAAPLVRPGGELLLELPGAESEPVVLAVAAVAGWAGVTVRPDLVGLPRILRAVRG